MAPPAPLHDGSGDSVQDLRESEIADAPPSSEFCLIFADHRGHGRSDKPHDPAAYAIPLRVADAVAVLDRLGIERAHFIGRSWGGPLCFGVGEHAPERARSLIIGGNQPYGWPDSPPSRLAGDALSAGHEQASMEPLARAFEEFWEVEFPAPQRARLLDNDPVALRAAWSAAMAEGAIAADLHTVADPVPDLHRRGGRGLPRWGAHARPRRSQAPHCRRWQEPTTTSPHMSQSEVVLEAVLRTPCIAA